MWGEGGRGAPQILCSVFVTLCFIAVSVFFPHRTNHVFIDDPLQHFQAYPINVTYHTCAVESKSDGDDDHSGAYI